MAFTGQRRCALTEPSVREKINCYPRGYLTTINVSATKEENALCYKMTSGLGPWGERGRGDRGHPFGMRSKHSDQDA